MVEPIISVVRASYRSGRPWTARKLANAATSIDANSSHHHLCTG